MRAVASFRNDREAIARSIHVGKNADSCPRRPPTRALDSLQVGPGAPRGRAPCLERLVSVVYFARLWPPACPVGAACLPDTTNISGRRSKKTYKKTAPLLCPLVARARRRPRRQKRRMSCARSAARALYSRAPRAAGAAAAAWPWGSLVAFRFSVLCSVENRILQGVSRAPPPGGHGRLTLSIHTWISFAGRTTKMNEAN